MIKEIALQNPYFAKYLSLALFVRKYPPKNRVQNLLLQRFYLYYISLLNKFRDLVNPTLIKVGTVFAATGLSANVWTCLSLGALTLAGIIYATSTFTAGFSWFYLPVIASLLVLVGGFFDIVDGSVARITRQMSQKGSFLDSIGDRISESVIYIGIAVGNLAEPVLCLVALSSSFLVSYVRAKAESLGVNLVGSGVGERAERLLILALVGLVPNANAIQWAVILVSIVACCTVIHRIFVTSKKLSKSASHTPV